ncbi:MAG: hypothetical protein AAGK32_04050, partial [Actinomycetota bacterium]
VLAACGDDSGAGGDAAGEAPATTAAAPLPATGAVVIDQVDPATITGNYADGTDVAPGAVMAMGPLTVSVEGITAGASAPSEEGGTAGSVAVSLVVDNPSGDAMAGPDVYGICVDDGRIGFLELGSEYESLAGLPPGGQLAGSALVRVPVDCADFIVQIRVLAVTPGGDHIADVIVPPNALP